MARYRKIDPRIWNDQKFRELSDNGKLVFLMLLTHPHMTAIGAMRGTMGGLADELGWSVEAFREAFREASAKGMAEHDERASFVALPNFVKYNAPESPNVVKAWNAALDLLPECPLKSVVIQRAKAFAEALPEAFTKALPEAFAKGMPNQEQEQEPEQEQEQEDQEPLSHADACSGTNAVERTEGDLLGAAVAQPGKRTVIPVERVVALYHELLPSNTRCEKLTAKRRGHIQARWRSDLPTLDAWRNFFTEVGQSKFLTGRIPPKPPRTTPFVADIDWLINENNFVKVLEGKFS